MLSSQYLPQRPLTRAQGGHGLSQPSGPSHLQTQTECCGLSAPAGGVQAPGPRTAAPTWGLRDPRLRSPFLHCCSQAPALPRGGSRAPVEACLPTHQRPSHPLASVSRASGCSPSPAVTVTQFQPQTCQYRFQLWVKWSCIRPQGLALQDTLRTLSQSPVCGCLGSICLCTELVSVTTGTCPLSPLDCVLSPHLGGRCFPNVYWTRGSGCCSATHVGPEGGGLHLCPPLCPQHPQNSPQRE